MQIQLLPPDMLKQAAIVALWWEIRLQLCTVFGYSVGKWKVEYEVWQSELHNGVSADRFLNMETHDTKLFFAG